MEEQNANFKDLLEDKIVVPVKAQFEAIKQQILDIQAQNKKLKIWLAGLSFITLVDVVFLIVVYLKKA